MPSNVNVGPVRAAPSSAVDAPLSRRFPGASDEEVFKLLKERALEAAARHDVDFTSDEANKTATASKAGIRITATVRDGVLTFQARYSRLVPGFLRTKVEQSIQRQLDTLPNPFEKPAAAPAPALASARAPGARDGFDP